MHITLIVNPSDRGNVRDNLRKPIIVRRREVQPIIF